MGFSSWWREKREALGKSLIIEMASCAESAQEMKISAVCSEVAWTSIGWPSFDVSVSASGGGALMKRKTHGAEEILCILRQVDGGETAQAICCEHNLSE